MASVPAVQDQQQPQQNDGTIVPKESPVHSDQPYGPNNVNLPQDMQDALRSMCQEFAKEGLVSRRHEILRCRRARFYWQGQQYLWFDWDNFDWQVPYQGGFTISDDKDAQEQPRYAYVMNVYQPFGLAFIAVFASQVPTVHFYPQSLNRSEDVTAAKAASNASDLIEENNQIQRKMIDVARFLWTDGKVGAHVDYVADAERFGYADASTIDEGFAPMGEDSFVCPQCQAVNPISSYASMDEQGNASMQAQPTCLSCGTALDETNFKPAPRVPVPINKPDQVPAGQEVINFYGGLELHTPPWCNDFWEYPWLRLSFEVDKAKPKAAYPQ